MAAAKRRMSDEHKQALAEGRRLGQAVREYLEALEEHKPKRGRKRTAESVKRRLETVSRKLDDAKALERVQLLQERMDLENELSRMEQKVDLSKVENAFVKAAKEYSHRKGLTYAAWRKVGVPADVLRKAGINRGFDPNA